MTHDRETVRRLLERDLVDWSDDADLRLIWADLLQLDGDPLGTLVVLDHVGADPTSPPAAAAQARAEAEILRRSLHGRLWDGPPLELPGVTLTWRRGFVSEVHVEFDRLVTDSTPQRERSRWDRRAPVGPVTRFDTLIWFMPRLVHQPALRWLERIDIDVDDEQAGAALSWIHEARHRMTNACLREIHVGRPARARLRPAGAWEARQSGPTWGALHIDATASLRQLRRVSIAGELVRLPCCPGNSQTKLHLIHSLETRPLTGQNRTALARSLFDASTLVHQAGFATARKLGPRAEFLLDDLAWFLRPPLSKKDPRPIDALRTIATIGPASVALLPELLTNPQDLVQGPRLIALLDWLAALGPAGARGRSLLDAAQDGNYGALSGEARAALARARRAVLA